MGRTLGRGWWIVLTLAVASCQTRQVDVVQCTGNEPPSDAQRVVFIDIDDHALGGLWQANAPHLKALAARGTFALSRTLIPTRSNANNMALLTGQYPDGHGVPANTWLERANNFTPPISLMGISLGNYAFYDQNPLRVRSDSLYRSAARVGASSAYIGQLPPFEVGADRVHLAILGETIDGQTVSLPLLLGALPLALHYPISVVNSYAIDGPPDPGESATHFVLRDAARFVRASCAERPLPRLMFVWALLEDDTAARSPADKVSLIEDYDAGIGDLLAALSERGLLEHTNIIVTLDHGKVDVHKQAVLGTRPGDGQLGALVAAAGAGLGITSADYEILNEEGDAQVYARVDGAGTSAGAKRQKEVTQALLSLVQSGKLLGVDTTRTATFDGAQGTRRFHDLHISGPNQADILLFAQDDWALHQVDPADATVGAFAGADTLPFARHGGLSVDELYVPVIMTGPAFRQGVILPHLVRHPDVAATAAWVLGRDRLIDAAGAPIWSAFVGATGEIRPQPADMTTVRASILQAAGHTDGFRLAGAAASSAVVIDVAGLYHDEVFGDAATASAAAPLRALAAQGTTFTGFRTRYRDWPVNEYELLTGGYPVDPWVPFAEDDPTEIVPPALGLLKEPSVAGFVADPAGYQAWRETASFGRPSIFDAARAMGLYTALVGELDFQTLHIDTSKVDLVQTAGAAAIADTVRSAIANHPRAFVLVSLGQARVGAPHSEAWIAELAARAALVRDVAGAAQGALVAVISRGATTIRDPAADSYGAGSSRHVPFFVLGPNVAAGVVTGEPGEPADVMATVLAGLGAVATPDAVDGLVVKPAPSHVLVRAYQH